MKINWQEEVSKIKEAYFEDLCTLLRIPSVREDDKATEEAPFGPGPKKALDTFLEMAKRDGFPTKNVANVAGRLEFGQGNEIMGIIGHLDVVPVDDSWLTDPFEPTFKDGKLYARGVSDDKGPMLACYYALKMIRNLKLPVSKKVHFIVGTDEESDWRCLHRYLETEPLPDFGISPDAMFPVINGEKGGYTVDLKFGALQGVLKSFTAGQRENMVPGEATAVIEGFNPLLVQEAADQFNAQQSVQITVEEKGQELTVIAHGKVSHGAFPENGHNAATYLAAFLTSLDAKLEKDPYLSFIANVLHLDFKGQKVGISHHDPVMGDLSLNSGVFYKEGDKQVITVNIRFPQGQSLEQLDARFDELGQQFGFERVTGPSNKLPHYVPMDDPLVKTLLAVYEEHTGMEGYETVIGGGTYARLMKRGVAFGAEFPDEENTMHEPNEVQSLDRLLLTIAIYADAIYRLIQ